MKHTLSTLFIIILVYSGCKKDFPKEDNAANPVFSFKGTINGTPITINAGDDDYYMYSSHTQDTSGVYKFIGEIKKNNCTFCSNSLKIQINDDTVVALGANSNGINSLLAAYYAYESPSGGTPTKYVYNFSAEPDTSRTVVNYEWRIKNNNLPNLPDLTITTLTPNLQWVSKHPGNYNICLKIKYTDCDKDICNSKIFGIPNAPYSLIITDTAQPASNQINFGSNFYGTPVSYDWNFGGLSNSTAGPNATFTFPAPGLYKVCLTIRDINNVITSVCRNVRTYQYTADCITNFYDSSIVYLNNKKLSNINISWTDNNGVTYSSKNILQPKASYFEVLSVEDYKTNENGEPTKKIRAKIKSTLSNGSSSVVMEGEATFAVSY